MLDGKSIAIVTGGFGALGRTVCKQLESDGWRVTAVP